MANPDNDQINTFPTILDYDPDSERLFRKIIRVLSNAVRGKTNNVRYITLNANATTTDIPLSKDVVSAKSYINFMPVTANAATEFGAGSLYVSSINDSDTSSGTLAAYSIRITHANTVNDDKKFKIVIVG